MNDYLNTKHRRALYAAFVYLSSFFLLIISLENIINSFITWSIKRANDTIIDKKRIEAINLTLLCFNLVIILILGVVLFIAPISICFGNKENSLRTFLFSLQGVWSLISGLGILALLKSVFVIIASNKIEGRQSVSLSS